MIGVACALAGTLARANAQVNVTMSAANLTDAYMSWSPSAYTQAVWPGDGGAAASTWSLAANPAVFSGNTLTISPNVNTYAPGVTYWTNPDGSGANTMDADTYDEVDGGAYSGVTLTFTVNVLANTLGLDSTGFAGYSADMFIKDFGPGYAFNGEATTPLNVGTDSVQYTAAVNPGEIVQYGVELIGIDTSTLSSQASQYVEIAPVPEPSSIALVAVGLLGALTIRRRKA
jgi:hypothetical protein